MADFNDIVAPNTYENFFQGRYIVVKKVLEEDNLFLYSEGGLSFPNFLDNQLKKIYSSAPLGIALARQLWGLKFIVNTQNIERVWKMFREQIGDYIICNSCRYNVFRLGGRVVVLKCSYFRRQILSDKIEKIRDLKIVFKLRKDHYDTRYFHKKLFGTNAPSK